jgi:tripartite-type tricarboxylate transporter receptor subunit TctC
MESPLASDPLRPSIRNAALVAGALIVLLSNPGHPLADDVADFYRGKTIRLVIGTGEGGGFDISGRIAAKYISRYIPGNPTVIPQNMPGAAGIRAAEYMYHVAPQDGSVLGITLQFILLNAIIDPTVRFAPDKFEWIGRFSSLITYGVVWHTAPAQTLEAAKKESLFLGAAPGVGPGVTVVTALNRLIGTKYKIVQGYTSGNESCLAMERGEIQGISSVSWELLNNRGWIDNKSVTFLYQNSLGRTPKVPGVPTIVDVVEDDSARAIMKLVASPSELGRAIMAPPKVPAERVLALRQAFDRLMQDQDFRREAEASGVELDSVPGGAVQKLVADAMAVSPAVVARARQVLPKS